MQIHLFSVNQSSSIRRVLDQNGLPMAFPVQVTYSGNTSSLLSPRLITGIDQFSFTSTIPNNYTLTASFSSVSDFTCSDTLSLPPQITAISSPVAPDRTTAGR